MILLILFSKQASSVGAATGLRPPGRFPVLGLQGLNDGMVMRRKVQGVHLWEARAGAGDLACTSDLAAGLRLYLALGTPCQC